MPAQKPRYFPIERGLYEVAPGLKPFGFDFGNGEMDQKLFQISADFSKYRENKLAARRERIGKYFITKNLTPQIEFDIARFIMHQLIKEYPAIFSSSKPTEFCCSHTGDEFKFSSEGELLEFNSSEIVMPTPMSLLDALALQICEDFALLQRDQNLDYLSCLHLCSPSHWAAQDKIGLNFFKVHSPIPGSERMLKAAENLVDAMVNKGPFVRFVWSFVTDTRLNHHPNPPPRHDPALWKGRSFNKDASEPFYLRVERQATWGFPSSQTSLFTIGLSFIAGSEIKKNATEKSQLLSALKSMSPESRIYKGVAACFDDLIEWLG